MADGSAIALVGMSCRAPMAGDPAALWELLQAGSSAIRETPEDRRPAPADEAQLAAGARYGGFLDRVDRFDCGFFGISPREAALMDPQQRLMLELCWEALEDAAVPPDRLEGSQTGVFVGSISSDYADLLREQGAEALTHHALTGLHRSLIANRVSYTLGLRGPSMTVDTGQSSSLVAVHLACESLRRGESTLALACGVHLNISSSSALSASRFGALSPDGRCFTFDARANGYVRGEGGGVVVLKPLSEALAARDLIYGVIRASVVNNDGGGEGLTAPSQQAQEEVLRRAYRKSGVRRGDVQYVELHGTGTKLGDRVEASALGAVLGDAPARERELVVGSVKTNIGHLEGAAGILGLIKAALCIRHREIPPSLNFQTPPPDIPLQALGLRVQQELTPWTDEQRPLSAGVSSFGVGGTNCHVVLTEPPAKCTRGARRERAASGELDAQEGVLAGRVSPWLLSAREDTALREQAARLVARVDRDAELTAEDVAHTLVVGRQAFARRAVVLGSDREALLGGLRALAAAEPAVSVIEGVAPPGVPGGAVFVFPGQGSQWLGMGLELLECSTVFAERMQACAQALAEHVDWSLFDVLRGAEGAPGLERIEVVQPALFAMMVSLAALWEACGVRPVAVVGHSQGEIAAAHIAGGLSLRDATRLVVLRSRVLRRLVGRGGVVSVAASRQWVDRALERWEGRISVGGINGPRSVGVVGEPAALSELLELCASEGVRAREVHATVASHSSQVEPLREELLRSLSSIEPQSGEVPFYSTVTGGRLDTAQLGPGYWYRNTREPVQFERTVCALLERAPRAFIEVSPHPVLTVGVQEILEQLDGEHETGVEPEEIQAIGTLVRGQGSQERLLTALAEAWVAGVEVDWAPVTQWTGVQHVELPTYPFRRERHWLTLPDREMDAPAANTASRDTPSGDTPSGDTPLRDTPLRDTPSRGIPSPDALPVRGESPLARRLAGASPAERRRIANELVCEQVAVVLGYDSPGTIDSRQAFKDLGFDSRAALALRNRLRVATGMRLPSSLSFDNPTPAAVADYLLRELTSGAARIEPSIALATTAEPIAILGMSCRLPGGVRSAEDLWELLVGGVDAIAGFPTDRGWDLGALYDPDPDRPGTAYTREGGFVHDVGHFDAAFFGISPREALAMDPQQRLMLEASWEAIEHAGLDPHALRGSSTAVFAGTNICDYNASQWLGPDGLEGYNLTGAVVSVISGRVAYALGLEGPAVTVDTACSSSLVTLHLACAALRAGECSLALAGGSTVLATPALFAAFSRQRALAADGRCKAFASSADGTSWGEGVGVLLLERLSDARRNGHEVLGLVRGSAVNQDGASNGLMAPNGQAQQRVIRQALASAALSPSDVDAVEAHGTGTQLGDPIEAHALLATYGSARPKGRPLWLGSVKSNIGHTQAAAGVAGVIKMVMAMRHGVLPKTLHVDEPSAEIDWSSGTISLLRENVPWAREDRPLRAGVSSYGISGTNAHVIVEQGDVPVGVVSSHGDSVVTVGGEAIGDSGDLPNGTSNGTLVKDRSSGGGEAVRDHGALSNGAVVKGGYSVETDLLPWVVSGKGAGALSAQARRLRAFTLSDPVPSAKDVAYSLAGRPSFDHRAVVLADSRTGLMDGLGELAEESGALASLDKKVMRGKLSGDGRVALLFTGQGSQRVGMGRELYSVYPEFREAFEQACGHFDELLGRSLRAVVFGEEHHDGAEGRFLDQTLFTQTGLFALEVALARLVASFGVCPDFVVGHSIGELAAAHIAGVFSLEDGCRLVAARGRLMGELPAGGAMLAVQATEAEALVSLERYEGRASLAAVNGPNSVVLSGDEDAVVELADTWEREVRKTKRLRVSHAFHSPRMDAMLEEFERIAATVNYREPTIALVSNLTGQGIGTAELCSASYWVRQVREPVRFADGVRWLGTRGIRSFLELGPDGVLSAMTRECFSAEAGGESAIMATPALRGERPEVEALLSSLAHTWVRGVELDWAKTLTGDEPRRVRLPTYAFQRERYWLDLPSDYWHERGEPSEPSGSSTIGGWLYRASWKPLVEDSPAVLSGRWLVLAPAGSVSESTVANAIGALEAHGANPVALELELAGLERRDLAKRLSMLLLEADSPGHSSAERSGPARPQFAGVLSLLALEEASECSTPRGLSGTLALAQALADAEVEAPLWILTCGALSVDDSDRLEFPLQAMPWGLVRTLRLESPTRGGGLVDLPTQLDTRSLDRLCGVLGRIGGEEEFAIRPAASFVRRLTRVPAAAQGEGSWAPPRGTVLVSGGTGALGGHLARRLARAGAEHLLLVSRRGIEAPGARELESELAATGVQVSVAVCDVADREQLRGLLATVPGERPLAAVFHVAGVLEDALVEQTTPRHLEVVLRAKVEAAWNLHELTESLGLESFVMFSSLAATLGSRGQSSYAAANSFLDALAEYRRARGLAATSIAWGAWAGGGMAADASVSLRRVGVLEMEPELALDAMESVLAGDEPCTAIGAIDWARYAPSYTATTSRPLLEDIPEARVALGEVTHTPSGEDARGDGFVRRLAGLGVEERERVVLDFVRSHVAAVLGYRSLEEVEAQRTFKDLGLDSLGAMDLSNRLQHGLGMAVPATAPFDHPTPAMLSLQLLEELLGESRGIVAPTLRPRAAEEPLAIVGIGCRLPGGVRSPEQLWQLVSSGSDAIGEFPRDRGWDLDRPHDVDSEDPGVGYPRRGGFLYDAAEFDAGFFGIGPREAAAMDPQQRLLLEISWEAFEHAGIDPRRLKGSDTGVFVGAIASDYGMRGGRVDGGDALAGYGLTGSGASIISGRVAYVFGLEGPAVTIDTACSSSLVATHIAAQALRSGECSLALAGGVTVLASPSVFVEFARQGGLASDGRCKPFADGADGVGWSEGAATLVLERLSDAQSNGHEVLALLRGSAINQDGASNGLTAPNGPSQRRVVRQALAAARLSSADVDVVEAHGTGTKLGDPIEVQALLATYGEERPEGRSLWLGSLKSNVGHTQAAAGVASVVKTVMAMRHGLLPRTLHSEQPSSQVDWSSGAISLLNRETPWPRGDRPRRAGVSSFGISGTNAHVILEEAPFEQGEEGVLAGERGTGPLAREAAADSLLPWLVSGRDERALREQAERLRAFITADTELGVAEVGRALTLRTAFERRAVLLGSAREQLLGGLDSLAAGHSAAGVIEGVASEGSAGIAFLFTGQGTQRLGMGRGLYDELPSFKDALDEVCSHLDTHIGRSLRAVMFAEDGSAEADLLGQTHFTQTALFALEVALFRLVESFGVKPSYLLGHSIGELVAAHVAGVFSLEDACRVVAARGRLMGELPGSGAMVAVQAGEHEVLPLLDGRDGVALAAVNSPASVVVSGERDAVLELASGWEREGRKVKRLDVSHAFHSPHMDGMLEAFAGVLGDVSFSEPAIPVVSNVTGVVAKVGELCSVDYWLRHVSATVRFADGVRWIRGQGVSNFLELGPEGALSAMAQECADGESSGGEKAGRSGVVGGAAGGVVGGAVKGVAGGAVKGVVGERLDGGGDRLGAVACALRSGREDEGALLDALGRIWANGVGVDWSMLFQRTGARRVVLPTYAFQRERYWLDAAAPGAGDISAAGLESAGHPLLGAALSMAEGEGLLLTGRLSLRTHPWLIDHMVMGRVLIAGTALLELVLRAASEAGCGCVRELTLQTPLVLPEECGVQLQVSVADPDETGCRVVRVYSRGEGASEHELLGESDWVCNAEGVLAQDGPGSLMQPSAVLALDGQWPPSDAQAVDVDDLYSDLAELGLEYGPSFRCLRAAWRRGEELLVEVELSQEQQAQAGSYGVHPALLDAVLHALAGGGLLTGEGGGNAVKLPFCWNDVTVGSSGASSVRACLRRIDTDTVSLVVVDRLGRPVVSIGSLAVRATSAAQIEDSRSDGRDSLFLVDWTPMLAPATAPRAPGERWVLLGEDRFGLLEDLQRSGVQLDLYADPPALHHALQLAESVPAVVLVCCPGAEVADLESDEADRLAVPAEVHARVSVEVPAEVHAEVPAGVRAAVAELSARLGTLLADERLAGSRLVVVTCGAVAVDGGEDVLDLAGAAARGAVRSAQTENPGRLVLLDIDSETTSHATLVEALATATMIGESQLVIRAGTVLVARLVSAAKAGGLVRPAVSREWRLKVGLGGTLEDFVLAPTERQALEPGQVRVEMRAAGLNFRDVLIALGSYPGGGRVGSEGAGVVLEVGSEVADLLPGDRVMGLFEDGFGPVVVTDRRLLVRMPATWSFAQAASVPIAFLTAHYALIDLAGIERGERLLVHSAAGGVGMAATQLARHLGAEVFGTASEGKWSALERLGLERSHIASSRTLDFKQRILQATEGVGVDAVLDCLAGEFVDASLELLSEGGRFLEMGKADIRDAGTVGERHDGVLYRAFDLKEAGADRIQAMLVELLDMFERGLLEPPPVRVWDMRQSPRAFRFMSQARHVGKNVLMLPSPAIDPLGTVLIVGGTGGLGGALARHLVLAHGARHLVLASRRGPQAPGGGELRGELERLGAEVKLVACDVAEPEQVGELVDSIGGEHPLRTVVHAAGVLDDGLLGSLSPDRIDRVLRPKVDGAWHLHEMTRHLRLDAFVVFSSASATFGGAGQGSYAAANAFLDALAGYRRAQGLPGVSLAWGQWQQATELTGHLGNADLARIGRVGMLSLSTERGLELFDAALALGEAMVVPARLDLATLRSRSKAGELPALLRYVAGVREGGLVSQTESLGARLLRLSGVERERAVLDFVCAQAAVVLGHSSPRAIIPGRAFRDLGFDSLAAVELRNRLASATGSSLPATLVFNHPTPEALATYVVGVLARDLPAGDTLSVEFDKLETALSSASEDPDERERVAMRLRMFLSRWGEWSSAEQDGAQECESELDGVSDEEMFDLIDSELGVS
jgi:acyl transferase domain-containing protein/NADPH:quinone reductase-like Zn-dependent oxidoreductase/acyl carrier protein